MATPTEPNPLAFADQPQTVDWRTGIAIYASRFFGAGSEHAEALEVLGRAAVAGRFDAFTISDLIVYLGKVGWGDQSKNSTSIQSVVLEMERAGILTEVGAPTEALFGRKYILLQHATRAQSSGLLWLTRALGMDFLARSVGSVVVPITGTHRRGGVQVGSGLLLDGSHLLTCAHVVNDMLVDEYLEVPTLRQPMDTGDEAFGRIRVVDCAPHLEIDVALLTVDSSASSVHPLAGLVFRDPDWTDRVGVFGFPPVPMARSAPLIVQMGEVVSPEVKLFHGEEIFLYSATTRPGNSGGPVVAHDGRIVGMVTKQIEVQSAASVSPYYAAIPSSVIRSALTDLGFSDIAVMEDWG